MDNEMKKMVRDIIHDELEKFKVDNFAFRKWHKFDSVTDRFSAITGASQQIGFFGTNKISKPTVTGAKGGNAALGSLMTQLSNLGLVTDGTSA